MKNVGKVKDCFGCGVCGVVCARDAIKIELNQDGFYGPRLDLDKCVDCGLCVGICAFLHEDLALQNSPKSSYGAWSNNPMIRKRSSSGGVGYELGKYLLCKGYKVCAVRYNAPKQRAEHYIASDEGELMLSSGSKYIQSFTVDGFKAIKRKEKYLVTGTPCQIDSFRRYIRKFKVEDNFVLMDFFCHSVPSMLVWKKYLQIVEKQTGPVTYASWRSKSSGWHDSYHMHISGENHPYSSKHSDGDIFFRIFLGNYSCNPACQRNCKYKYDKSSADIRIGDFWGATYAKDENGVSSVVVFTDRGSKIFKQLDCTSEEHSFSVVTEGQMKRNVGKHFLASIVSLWLKLSGTNRLIIKVVFMVDWMTRFPKRAVKKLRILLRR